MVSDESQFPRPVLAALDARGSNDELLRGGVVRGSGFEPLHVRTVAELCLSVGADDSVRVGVSEPLAALLVGPEQLQRGDEHNSVYAAESWVVGEQTVETSAGIGSIV